MFSGLSLKIEDIVYVFMPPGSARSGSAFNEAEKLWSSFEDCSCLWYLKGSVRQHLKTTYFGLPIEPKLKPLGLEGAFLSVFSIKSISK